MYQGTVSFLPQIKDGSNSLFNMNNKGLSIAAIAVFLIATVSITTDGAYATRKRTLTTVQENACGNSPLPLDIFCLNAGSQLQGRHNDVDVSVSQPSTIGNATGGP